MMAKVPDSMVNYIILGVSMSEFILGLEGRR